MTEPQVWVLIGVFAAIMLGGFTLTTTLILNAMKAGFTAVDAKFEAVDAKFEAMDAKFEAGFDAVGVKLEHLDRDVSALMRHTFGIAE
ncbi:hypothetical protein J4H92_13460 [Leucobacter weissii]|uniref:Uncharacterized protein n=1 Tax=Leucobacter weissii TaxID=1983706 RepID=A0A939SD00_9MICO|nr:hypothetical protein [Leucobacter weissii]